MAERWTIATAEAALRAGEVTALELTQHCLATIAAEDPTLRAFVTVTTEAALAEAQRADEALRAGRDSGPLHGIPIGLKDLIATRGVLTTGGSAVLSDNIPEADAPIVGLLTEAGAVVIGKTNTHEFAWGVFTPPTRNPWNRDHIPGGSSGGSAAAVATGEVLGAIGTDTGGSIRIPSACCGVTGHKPTYGLVDTTGIIPLSTSLDHAGPIARTAQDCAIMLDVLTRQPAPYFAAQLAMPFTEIRLGIVGGQWEEAVDVEVLQIVRAAITVFGAHLPTIAPPAISHPDLFALYRGIQGPEAAASHLEAGWYPARAERYTALTRERLERALAIPATRYVAAQRAREQYRAAWEAIYRASGCDLFLAPTLAIAPPTVVESADPARAAEYADGLLRLTFPINLIGWPALSVPCGFTASGLPVGLQIIGPAGADALVLRAGHIFQQRNFTAFSGSSQP